MNKINLLILLFLCIGRISAQSNKATPPIDGYKYIQIDDANHNFGRFTYGKAIGYSVKMKNISQDTLQLNNVIVSCGCTTPEYTPGNYPPDSVINMHIGFNGYTEGKLNKTMSVLFEDKGKPFVVILRFTGEGIKKESSTK